MIASGGGNFVIETKRIRSHHPIQNAFEDGQEENKDWNISLLLISFTQTASIYKVDKTAKRERNEIPKLNGKPTV